MLLVCIQPPAVLFDESLRACEHSLLISLLLHARLRIHVYTDNTRSRLLRRQKGFSAPNPTSRSLAWSTAALTSLATLYIPSSEGSLHGDADGAVSSAQTTKARGGFAFPSAPYTLPSSGIVVAVDVVCLSWAELQSGFSLPLTRTIVYTQTHLPLDSFSRFPRD